MEMGEYLIYLLLLSSIIHNSSFVNVAPVGGTSSGSKT